MWELIKELLTSPFGSFASVLSASIFLLWLAVKAGSIIEKFKAVGKLEYNIEEIKKDMTYVKATIEIFQQNNSRFAQSQSPINLNEMGRKVSVDLDAKTALDHVWSNIKTKIKDALSEEKDHNPYTIQEICFDLGRNYSKYLTKEDMLKVKSYAFQEGHNLAEYDILFGIEIRNRYFKEKNIQVEEVDKHAPSK